MGGKKIIVMFWSAEKTAAVAKRSDSTLPAAGETHLTTIPREAKFEFEEDILRNVFDSATVASWYRNR